MENNNLPVNEPTAEPEISSPAEETKLSQGNLSEPVLSGAAAFTAAETTSPDSVEVKTEETAYVPPTVELPTLIESNTSGGSEGQTSRQTANNPQFANAQQPIYVQQAPQTAQNNQSNHTSGFSIASLVLGIVSVVSCIGIIFGFVGVICGLLGIIFAICGFKKCRSGMNGAGLALSIVGLLLSSVLSCACASVCYDSCEYIDDGCYWYYDYDDGYTFDDGYNYYA